MLLSLRRLIAVVVFGCGVLLAPVAAARADTPSPSPSATASASPGASASPSATGDGSDDTVADTPDMVLDNTSTIVALGAAGALALLAGVIVLVRR
jgi:hypothetical protein